MTTREKATIIWQIVFPSLWRGVAAVAAVWSLEWFGEWSDRSDVMILCIALMIAIMVWYVRWIRQEETP